jgi:hypothetical protein
MRFKMRFVQKQNITIAYRTCDEHWRHVVPVQFLLLHSLTIATQYLKLRK